MALKDEELPEWLQRECQQLLEQEQLRQARRLFVKVTLGTVVALAVLFGAEWLAERSLEASTAQQVHK